LRESTIIPLHGSGKKGKNRGKSATVKGRDGRKKMERRGYPVQCENQDGKKRARVVQSNLALSIARSKSKKTRR